jgi:hypothetical protein
MKPEVVREVIPPETARFVSDAATEVVSERGRLRLLA